MAGPCSAGEAMKQPKDSKRIILNHDFAKVVEENGAITLYVKMANGQYAVQAPYPADLRGAIGALTLALDVLAGKIMLGGTVALNENEFKYGNQTAMEAEPIRVLNGKGGSNGNA